MRIIIVGLGVQGEKRHKIAGDQCVATVEIRDGLGDFKSVRDVPLNTFDAAILCLPDNQKYETIDYLLRNDKHVMVEKPLMFDELDELKNLYDNAMKKGLVLYTAYNHRFEPAFVEMKNLIESDQLGKIYYIRMFYGNGTARLVKDSKWCDSGLGVLSDLGSHLLDTLNYWFPKLNIEFEVIVKNKFENRVPDHVNILSSNVLPQINLEMTLCMWRNHFTCDVLAEKGSAHIESLCKWGPSSFIKRSRILPSGRPREEKTTLVREDPTWKLEYEEFKRLVNSGLTMNATRDVWIQSTLAKLSEQ